MARIWIALLLAVLPLGAFAAEDYEDSTDATPGGELRVELDAGRVEIEGHDEPEVRVDARASGFGSDNVEFELEGEGDDVRFQADLRGLSALLGSRVRVSIRVPHRYSLDVRTGGGKVEIEEVEGRVYARTSGGEVEVDRITGPVDLETSGGNIRAERVRGDLRARTSGGSIAASEITGRVQVQTSGGRLELRDIGGAVDARTSGGPIEVRFTGGPEGYIETSGGSIQVEFAAGSGLELDAETSGGRIELDRDLTLSGRLEPSRIEGKVNGGGPTLQIRTSGGNILLRTR